MAPPLGLMPLLAPTCTLGPYGLAPIMLVVCVYAIFPQSPNLAAEESYVILLSEVCYIHYFCTC